MFRLKELTEVLNGELLNFKEDIHISGISTDSREELKGKLFIPLIGEKFNGHNFIEQAFKKGAVASLSSEDRKINSEKPIIKVEDTLISLGKIAKYYIEKNNFKIIGITGSAGKTTTKNLLKHVTEFFGTEKNFNNLIGVPKTILSAKGNNEFIIVEMGINKIGEMEKLVNITTPEYAVITNIGLGHLEGFGSLIKLFKEKSLIIRNNPDLIKGFIHDKIDLNGQNILKFGCTENSHCRLIKSESDIFKNKIKFSYKGKIYSLVSKLLGRFNALNIINVFMIAVELGFDEKQVLEKIENFIPDEKRSEIIQTKENYYIFNDCYNANFESFREAIELMNEINISGKKIAVIGDMFELGQLSEELHSKLGEYISQSNIDIVVGTGELIKWSLNNINKTKKTVKYFKDKSKIIEFLKKTISESDLLLIKASRGMKFEEITEGILR